MARIKTIQVVANEKNLAQAQEFFSGVLKWQRANACTDSELMRLFEALFRRVVSQVDDTDNELEISSVTKLGRTDVYIKFAGKRFLLPEDDEPLDEDATVIENFSDKFSCSYQNGDNVIQISVGHSAWSFVLPNLVAVAAAIIVAVILEFSIDGAAREMLTKEWIAPLEKMFTNALLMIGAPMTLFSLLKNVTDSFIVAGRHSSSRRLFIKSMSSSVVVVALALIVGFVFVQWVLSKTGVTQQFDIGFANWSLAAAVDEIIPSSIIQPFETISPVPMIFVAVIIVVALNTIGKSFNKLKPAIDICYDLFSGILGILMAAFPFAVFLLFLEVLLAKNGLQEFMEIFFLGIIVFVCTIPLLLLYALRLKAHGIRVGEFVSKLWPLVKENFVIGSVIDAVPYNTRYCMQYFGISRERLNRELPILAQTSLDGNCFILMLLAAIYIFFAGCEVSWFNIAVVALIVMFLSFGAPNQPGSILIGMLVILTYLKSDTAISLALCFELFCGGLQNILNVISSVVTVAENECLEKKQSESM